MVHVRTHRACGAPRACVISASDRTGCIAARECVLLHVPAAQPPVGERRSPVDQFLDAVRAARRLRDAELLSAAGASHRLRCVPLRVVGCTWHAVCRLLRREARCGLPGASAVYAAVLLCGLLRDGAGGQAALHLQLLRSRRNARRAWCATCSMRRCDSAKCNVQDANIVSATMQTLSVSTCLRLHSPLSTGRTKGCAESCCAPTHERSAMPCARLRACAIWARARVVACVCVPCGAYELACHRCARAAGWRVWMHTCATYTKPSVQGRSSSTSEWSWATTMVRWPRPCHAGSSTWHAPHTMHHALHCNYTTTQ